MDRNLQTKVFDNHVTTDIRTGAASLYVGVKAKSYLRIQDNDSLLGSELRFRKTTPLLDVTLTFVTSSANENEITIGSSATASTTNLQNTINAHSVLSTLFLAYDDVLYDVDIDTIIEVKVPGTDGNSYTDGSGSFGAEIILNGWFTGGQDPISIGNSSTDGNSYIIGKDCGITSDSTDSCIISSQQCFIRSGYQDTTILASYDCSILQGDGTDDVSNKIIGSSGSTINFGGAIEATPSATGSYNTIIGGSDHKIVSIGHSTDKHTILGGEECSIRGSSTNYDALNSILSSHQSEIHGAGGWCCIINSWSASITDTDYANVIVGCDEGYIIDPVSRSNGLYSGQYNFITNGATECAIVGGGDNWINGPATDSVGIIGSWSTYVTNCREVGVIGSTTNTVMNTRHSVILGSDDSYVDDVVGVLVSGKNVNLHSNNEYMFVMGYGENSTRRQLALTSAATLTTNNTPTTLGNGILQIERYSTDNGITETLRTNAVYSFEVDMVGLQTATAGAGTIGDVCNKKYQGLVKNLGGTVTIVGAVTETAVGYDIDAEPWSLTFVPSGETLLVQFTGETDKTIKVYAKINLVELASS